MHFGRSASSETERETESALIDCLRAHRADLTHLYLVGDVFDAYIEYPTLVPKGVVRFQAEIASLTDAGVPVTYLLGNHDPWHRDYFETELGVTVVPDHCTSTHSAGSTNLRVFCAHGDEQAGAAGGRTTRFRRILRHPACVWLYRSLLPGDLGFRLAQRISRGMHDRAVNPDLVRALENDARSRLAETNTDLVVMGHTHASTLHTYTGGVYLNTGAWSNHRTFGRLSASGIHLARWNGSDAEVIEATDLPVSSRPTAAS
jgi:UDP-2,3-diacylglucosamine hydrolase